MSEEEKLFRIAISQLIKFADQFAGIEVHLFVSGKYVKLNYSNDLFIDILRKLQQKEVNEVYIKQEDCQAIINYAQASLSAKNFFDPNTVVEKKVENLDNTVKVVKEVIKQLGVTPETVTLIKTVNERTMGLLSESPNMFAFIQRFKKNCSEEFLQSMLTSFVMSLVIDQFQWKSEQVKEKAAMAKAHGADETVVYPRGPFDKEGSKALAALFKQDAGIVDRELKWEAGMTPEQRQAMPQLWREVFDVPPAQRTAAQKLVMVTSFVENAAENKAHQAAIKKFRAEKPKVETTMIMREAAKPRRTYLHIKGDFTRDGGEVKAHFPAALHPFKVVAGREPNRLDLARWLVDDASPLTARVLVNRIWQQYFGKGLAETENDFGTQGAQPTHRELLDWLAVEFRQPTPSAHSPAPIPYSLKGLHRIIVASATYRQSSVMRPDLQRVDANNKLLARQNRLRLDAEVVRDVCLTASDLLTTTIGGPSVYPPIPEGAMALGQRKQPWPTSTGPARYRRGLYTFHFRATPPPAMSVFDAPDGFSTCTRRIRSSTPLQALTLLNDQAFVEFAQALAVRILKEAPKDEAKRIEHAFRLCLARKPSVSEAKRLSDLLAAQTKHFTAAPEEAKALVGQVNTDAERAAWIITARVLLNLDETITRE